ncbi:amidase [Pseudomonas costantinii]|uniref:Amidase n=1 Tax=Pseudomonas costantinii TaxID=168469 RepID=A0A1H4ZIC8_9PSED|nr:amidase [Pseudomonas costantinii]NVZ22724.1 amidase [Pseudomonas costantinii]SED29181.1 amidase [Pseudomonas costantinii]
MNANNISELVLMQAHELAECIGLRQVSCREVMQAYLAHIERFNPQVNALISLQAPDKLLAQADQRDAELARGQYRGWMHGLPHAIKDLSLTQGIRTTLGSPLYKDFIPERDGIMVERIKAAGAIIIGKTNTPEFGLGSQSYNPLFGATGCAYDPSKTAGGSSGGAAAALALHLVPVADGSDMMGSLRNPAAFNNIFGFRPSQGRVPFDDSADLFFDQLGYEGPMARSVRDAALLLSVQAGPDARAPLSIAEPGSIFAAPLERDFKGTRVGWLGDFNGYLPMENGILSLCEKAFATFENLGCHIESVQPNFAPQRLWDSWRTLRHWSVAGSLGSAYAAPQKRAQLKPEACWEVENGLKLSASAVYAATVARSDWYRALSQLFDRFDYLLLPSAQVFPFDKSIPWPTSIEGRTMDTYHRWMEVVIPATLSGCPVANVQVGFNENGLPMGMQILGRHQADFAVLQLANAYEKASCWFARHPPALLSGSRQ